MLKGCSQGLAVGQGSSAPKLWSKERAKETPYTRSPGSPKADQVDSAADREETRCAQRDRLPALPCASAQVHVCARWGGAAHRMPTVVWMRVVIPTQAKMVPMS